MQAAWCEWHDDALVLKVRIQPRASRDEIVGPYGGLLKLRLAAPPVGGAANAHLIKFLAKLFRVPRTNVTVLSGATSREKRIRVLAPQRLPPGFPEPPPRA